MAATHRPAQRTLCWIPFCRMSCWRLLSPSMTTRTTLGQRPQWDLGATTHPWPTRMKMLTRCPPLRALTSTRLTTVGSPPSCTQSGGGHLAVTQYLLDFNSGEVELDRQSVPGGMTALMLAAARGHEKVLSLLLAAGADVTLLDASDNSVLHHAAQFGSLSQIKALRAAACSAAEQNKAGLT